ncbi:TetM/TetW/TetO/TetS family tetracycline resistance ribosomal protection protein, partial [Actinospica durhamensis]|nr:TetM/TetW/TetO/TetS family tetracycline resistance ribosomal protection protein [Actinospica durhamensis]
VGSAGGRRADGGSAGTRSAGGGIVELTGRVTAVEGGVAGEIARIAGLRDVRIGDRLGSPDGLAVDGFFAPPSLESVVTPRDLGQAGALFAALEVLAEGDPYIAVRRDEATRAISVRLYGEVQKEVIESTLAEEFGIAVSFSPSRTVYIERVARTASWVQERRVEERIFDFATVGLRVDPGAPGSGVGYGLEVELGGLPLSFHTAIEESVRRTLLTGPRGWEVTDCRVTVIDTAFFPPLSSAGHFRNMAALALNRALEEAGTELCEPVNRFELDVPAEGAARVLARVIAARGVPDEPQAGPRIWRLTGKIPAAEVAGFEQELRGLTRGEGVLLSEFDSYERC